MIRLKHRSGAVKPLPWLLVAVMLVLSAVTASAAGGRSEIVGDLLLRFNDCSNPDHKGPHTTFMVHDPVTERMTELDVSGMDASELKPGRKVRVSGGFVRGAAAGDHPHAVRVMKAEQVVLEEGAQGDAGAAEPVAAAGGTAPEVANAATLTELRCLLIFANTADTAAEVAKITKVQGILFTDSANVSAAIESATYGHYKLTHSRTVTVELPSVTASTTSDSTMENAMVAALPAAFTALGLTYNAADYDRLLLFLPNGTTGTTTAYGYLGGATPIRTVYSYAWTGTTFDGFVHELGHNFGLMHSSLGTEVYGDKTCVMGYSYLNRGNNSATYSAPKKVQKNWLAPYPGSHANLTQDATYDIYPISINPGTTPGMRVVQLSGTNYYISYRRYLPPYAWIRDTALGDKVYVHTCASINDYSYREKDMSLSGTYAAGTTNIIFERYGPSNQYATVSFDLADGNTKPVANAASVSVQSGASLGITLTGSDADNNTLTYSVVLNPTHGSLSGSAPNLTYTPSGGYTGADSFVFKVNDGRISSFATVSITVTPGNAAPVAANQSVAVFHNTAQPITLSATDADGNNLTYAVVAGPAHGVLSGSAPDLTYTPAIGYAGSDSFTFKANDGIADSNTATVSITVASGPNLAPTVSAGSDVTVALGAASAWTPAAMATEPAIWLDADRADSVTIISGKVSQWNDRSKHGRNVAQSNANVRPIYNPTGWSNGKGQMQFDVYAAPKTQSLGRSVTSDGISGSAYTLFVVVDARSLDSEEWISTHIDTNGKENRYQMNNNGIKVRSDASNGGSATASYVAGEQMLQFTLAASSSEVRRNGTQVAANSGTYTPAALTGNFSINGRNPVDGHAGMTGDIAEFIFLAENPDQATREKIEGYLAHKWGLAGNLPNNHPYLSGPPGSPGVLVNLDGTAMDPESDFMTSSWNVVSGPASVTFGSASSLETTATFTQAGTYVLRLTVNDGYNEVVDEVTITVDPTPPAAYTSWAGGLFANAFSQKGVNQDPDGDGVSNLMEFAFGMDPTKGDRRAAAANGAVHGMPFTLTHGDGSAFDYVFVRRVNHGTSGSLSYTAQFSSDLVTFYDSPETPAWVADSTADPAYEVAKVPYTDPLPNGQKAIFARVKLVPVP